jgi:hypothetical protein
MDSQKFVKHFVFQISLAFGTLSVPMAQTITTTVCMQRIEKRHK